MLSSRIFLFDNTSLDALLVLYIYVKTNYVLVSLMYLSNIECASLVEEIKKIIIISSRVIEYSSD